MGGGTGGDEQDETLAPPQRVEILVRFTRDCSNGGQDSLFDIELDHAFGIVLVTVLWWQVQSAKIDDE